MLAESMSSKQQGVSDGLNVGRDDVFVCTSFSFHLVSRGRFFAELAAPNESDST
jgi:hypothetical protein